MRRPASISELPDMLALFPLSRALLLPGTHRPLNVFEPRFVAMVDDALAGNRMIGLIQPRDTSEEAPRGQVPLEKIGCIGRITHFEEQAENRYFIILEGVCRFAPAEELTAATPYRQARIDTSAFSADFSPYLGEEAVDRQRLTTVLRSYAEFAQIEVDWEEIEEMSTGELINLAAMLGPYGPLEKQALLEAKTLVERAETLMALAEMEMARARSGVVLQ
ncbi:LON peptidase substrate-binding domain-containing protein [Pelagibacterium sp. 26DY04]|uniref:LON peptidase substrate-binding domain-containing protein n=1 Tax=Pelagibacterium sp. 26DY04 TaxID=2967130 RepID=UPI0028168C97|nr:LON peptidase substrate-binding domain-containing protein [Pelagibacterium sp. 26DY04]WMT86961.1 LON peptidase substrate-binding domain-containing protein [Pelagibacterium sp. 26DY04]